MTELWVPSDELLFGDTIAKAKVDNPFEPADIEAAGILLPEPDSDEASEAFAAVALAEIDDSEPGDGELESVDDDDVVEDEADVPVGAEA